MPGAEYTAIGEGGLARRIPIFCPDVSIDENPLSRLLYSILFYLAVPLVVLRVYWRSIKEPRYRSDLAQRFGFCPPSTGTERVWVHAVSAGETIAAVPLIKAIVATGRQVLVTNMTPTGRAQVERLLAAQLAEQAVVNCYVPYDLPGAVARFMRRSQPQALVIIDTELWPNLIHGAQQAGTRVLLLNARLSARSAAGVRPDRNPDPGHVAEA